MIIRREEQSDAGGLVVAMDQKHAREIVEVLHEISGERPVLAISDMPDDLKPSEEITRFARGKQLWLVAVQMVSEGVDIPRLAVGVYGTNKISRMFFKQFVGRFVSMRDGFQDQQARLYLPADGRLIQHALEIKEERDLALREDTDSSPNGRSATTTDQSSTYQPGDARLGPKTVVWEGGLVVSDELLRGTQELEKNGVRDPSERIVTIAAMLTRSSQTGTEPEASPGMPLEEPHYETRGRKRRQAAALGRRLALTRQQRLGGEDH